MRCIIYSDTSDEEETTPTICTEAVSHKWQPVVVLDRLSRKEISDATGIVELNLESRQTMAPSNRTPKPKSKSKKRRSRSRSSHEATRKKEQTPKVVSEHRSPLEGLYEDYLKGRGNKLSNPPTELQESGEGSGGNQPPPTPGWSLELDEDALSLHPDSDIASSRTSNKGSPGVAAPEIPRLEPNSRMDQLAAKRPAPVEESCHEISARCSQSPSPSSASSSSSSSSSSSTSSSGSTSSSYDSSSEPSAEPETSKEEPKVKRMRSKKSRNQKRERRTGCPCGCSCKIFATQLDSLNVATQQRDEYKKLLDESKRAKNNEAEVMSANIMVLQKENRILTKLLKKANNRLSTLLQRERTRKDNEPSSTGAVAPNHEHTEGENAAKTYMVMTPKADTLQGGSRDKSIPERRVTVKPRSPVRQSVDFNHRRELDRHKEEPRRSDDRQPRPRCSPERQSVETPHRREPDRHKAEPRWTDDRQPRPPQNTRRGCSGSEYRRRDRSPLMSMRHGRSDYPNSDRYYPQERGNRL